MISRLGLQNALVLVAVEDAKHPPQPLCTTTHSVQWKRTSRNIYGIVVSVRTLVLFRQLSVRAHRLEA
ncbi:hypothetical protein D7V96_21340 [bacterium D16-59]|nr:hypothetical protein D7V96_21340 [bacterium D16-59]